jgi:hypothetical protein
MKYLAVGWLTLFCFQAQSASVCEVVPKGEDQVEYKMETSKVIVKYSDHIHANIVQALNNEMMNPDKEKAQAHIRMLLTTPMAEKGVKLVQEDAEFLKAQVKANKAKWVGVEDDSDVDLAKVAAEHKVTKEKLLALGLSAEEAEKVWMLTEGSVVYYWEKMAPSGVAILGLESKEGRAPVLKALGVVNATSANMMNQFSASPAVAKKVGLDLVEYIGAQKAKGINVKPEDIKAYVQTFKLNSADSQLLQTFGVASADVLRLSDGRDAAVVKNMFETLKTKGDGVLLFGRLHQLNQQKEASKFCGITSGLSTPPKSAAGTR